MAISVRGLSQNEKLTFTDVIGDDAHIIVNVCSLSQAYPSCLTFAGQKVAPLKLQQQAAALSGVAIICTGATAKKLNLPESVLLVCDNPRLEFMRAVKEYFAPAPEYGEKHPSAFIDPTATIHPLSSIGPNVVIGKECSVGANTVIHANVVIYPGVSIGTNCMINSGTVIGADGYGYERNEKGDLEKFPHIGGVTIGNEVEIGSNTSIDRGTLGNTVIMDKVRIDNQVHISHNVVIGESAAVIAQSMIGGSVKIGKGAWIAPSAVIMNQMIIGESATVGLGAVVTKNVSANQVVMGSPAQYEADFKATRAAIKLLTND